MLRGCEKALLLANYFACTLLYGGNARLVRTEAKMLMSHRAKDRPTRLQPRSEIDDRLTVGLATAVIAGLSALSWAVVISIVMALRAVL